MDNYLIDRAALEKFADELIDKKPLNGASPEEISNKREELIAALDDYIGMAIFSKFTKEQNAEINKLLDSDSASEADFQNFFTKYNINLEQIMINAMKAYAAEYLGGQNG